MKIHAVAAECAGRYDGDRARALPSLRQYLYFLFTPTLVYRNQYPSKSECRVPAITERPLRAHNAITVLCRRPCPINAANKMSTRHTTGHRFRNCNAIAVL
ncbi:hypothetical protein EVAR_7122_1 [Eumeta japonica]|uniref:Uncharacterized protein n=1 Tax=Eumeta variegata TaxID=151549 RepID=A0A4C1U6H7_EUMVA|nr:hypothetical protein EVAR_7122_1 [Eumeta japonica]